METIKKQRIAVALRNYCARYGSQAKAAKALKMSATVVSNMLTGDWAQLHDQQWNNAASGIGYKEERWEAVETADFRTLNTILADCQDNSLVMSITGAAGSGKSFACRHYAALNPGVVLISCDSYWSRKDLIEELLTAMGEDTAGLTLAGLNRKVVRRLRMMDRPLIILDEADKLSDRVLNTFITLYNQLEDICGIVLIATSHLEKKLLQGVRYNKQGYNEIWSRLGRKCVPLHGVSAEDIVKVCEANGVTDQKAIDAIITDSESDLRRVARRVHAARRKAAIAARRAAEAEAQANLQPAEVGEEAVAQ